MGGKGGRDCKERGGGGRTRGGRRGRQKEEPRRRAGFSPRAVSHTVVHTFCLSVRASVCVCVVCLPYGGGRIFDDASAGRDADAALMHFTSKRAATPCAVLSRRRPGTSRRRRGFGVCSGPLAASTWAEFFPSCDRRAVSAGDAGREILWRGKRTSVSTGTGKQTSRSESGVETCEAAWKS